MALAFQANMEHKYLLIQPDVGLFFPAVDFVANKISEIADERAEDNVPVVVDCQRFRGMDYTAVKVISINLMFMGRNRMAQLSM